MPHLNFSLFISYTKIDHWNDIGRNADYLQDLYLLHFTSKTNQVTALTALTADTSRLQRTDKNFLKEACCSLAHAQFTGVIEEEQEANISRLCMRVCVCLLLPAVVFL